MPSLVYSRRSRPCGHPVQTNSTWTKNLWLECQSRGDAATKNQGKARSRLLYEHTWLFRSGTHRSLGQKCSYRFRLLGFKNHMVLGVEAMRYLAALALLTACTSTHAKPELTVFNTTINLNDDCSVSFGSEGNIQSYSYPFSKHGECRIVTHSGTNIVNTIYVNGMYILFIENNLRENNNCSSEYSAFGIAKEKSIHVTQRIKRSGSCNQDKEIVDFEYFSALLRPLEKEPHRK